MVETLSQNRVDLIGWVGQEADLRELAQGKKLARISLATNEIRPLPTGGIEMITTWHNLVAWGDRAIEMCTLKKGDRIYVEGKIQYRSYEDRTGAKRYTTEIYVHSFKLLINEVQPAPGQ